MSQVLISDCRKKGHIFWSTENKFYYGALLVWVILAGATDVMRSNINYKYQTQICERHKKILNNFANYAKIVK